MKEYNTFESAKKRLEEIASKLDDKNITLEKSIQLYEEGARLAEICYEKLNKAELRISQISLSEAGYNNEQ